MNRLLILDLIVAVLLSSACMVAIICGQILLSMILLIVLAYSDMVITHYRVKSEVRP